MAQGYPKEMIEQYMQAEENENKKKQKQIQKQSAESEKTRYIAQLALEEVQKCRTEIEVLHRSVKKSRTLMIIAIVIALICMAMVMGDELASLMSAMQ